MGSDGWCREGAHQSLQFAAHPDKLHQQEREWCMLQCKVAMCLKDLHWLRCTIARLATIFVHRMGAEEGVQCRPCAAWWKHACHLWWNKVEACVEIYVELTQRCVVHAVIAAMDMSCENDLVGGM